MAHSAASKTEEISHEQNKPQENAPNSSIFSGSSLQPTKDIILKS
jgi:hypothetical protein